jgi:hypothetical protein
LQKKGTGLGWCSLPTGISFMSDAVDYLHAYAVRAIARHGGCRSAGRSVSKGRWTNLSSPHEGGGVHCTECRPSRRLPGRPPSSEIDPTISGLKVFTAWNESRRLVSLRRRVSSGVGPPNRGASITARPRLRLFVGIRRRESPRSRTNGDRPR